MKPPVEAPTSRQAPPGGIDAEGIERVGELHAAAAHVGRRAPRPPPPRRRSPAGRAWPPAGARSRGAPPRPSPRPPRGSATRTGRARPAGCPGGAGPPAERSPAAAEGRSPPGLRCRPGRDRAPRAGPAAGRTRPPARASRAGSTRPPRSPGGCCWSPRRWSLVLYALGQVRLIVLPVIIALFATALLNRPVKFLRRRGLGPGIAAFVAMFVTVAAVTTLVVTVAPVGGRRVRPGRRPRARGHHRGHRRPARAGRWRSAAATSTGRWTGPRTRSVPTAGRSAGGS